MSSQKAKACGRFKVLAITTGWSPWRVCLHHLLDAILAPRHVLVDAAYSGSHPSTCHSCISLQAACDLGIYLQLSSSCSLYYSLSACFHLVWFHHRHHICCGQPAADQSYRLAHTSSACCLLLPSLHWARPRPCCPSHHSRRAPFGAGGDTGCPWAAHMPGATACLLILTVAP